MSILARVYVCVIARPRGVLLVFTLCPVKKQEADLHKARHDHMLSLNVTYAAGKQVRNYCSIGHNCNWKLLAYLAGIIIFMKRMANVFLRL